MVIEGGRDSREESSRDRSERQDRSGGGDRSDRIDRPKKSNAPIALSGRIDLSTLIVPAVGEIIECYVLSSSQETLKE